MKLASISMRRGWWTGEDEQELRNGGGSSSVRSDVECYNCHCHGHYASDCPEPSRRKENRQHEQYEKVTFGGTTGKVTKVVEFESADVAQKCMASWKQKYIRRFRLRSRCHC